MDVSAHFYKGNSLCHFLDLINYLFQLQSIRQHRKTTNIISKSLRGHIQCLVNGYINNNMNRENKQIYVCNVLFIPYITIAESLFTLSPLDPHICLCLQLGRRGTSWP